MKISYQRMYNVGLYLNERIGVEDEVPEGIDPMQVFHQLKELCDKAHKELNPEEMMGTVITPVVEDKEKEEEITRQFNALKEKIQNASSKAAAGQILFDSDFKKHPELKQLVNDKQP